MLIFSKNNTNPPADPKICTYNPFLNFMLRKGNSVRTALVLDLIMIFSSLIYFLKKDKRIYNCNYSTNLQNLSLSNGDVF